MIEDASRAARIQAEYISHNAHLPEMDRLLVGRATTALDALNIAATTANPGLTNAYEMLRGRTPSRHGKAFLQPAVDYSKLSRKADRPELLAFEPVSSAVSAGDPVIASERPKLPSAERVSEPVVESPAETALARPANRQLTTYNRDPDEATRTLGRTRA